MARACFDPPKYGGKFLQCLGALTSPFFPKEIPSWSARTYQSMSVVPNQFQYHTQRYHMFNNYFVTQQKWQQKVVVFGVLNWGVKHGKTNTQRSNNKLSLKKLLFSKKEQRPPWEGGPQLAARASALKKKRTILSGNFSSFRGLQMKAKHLAVTQDSFCN